CRALQGSYREGLADICLLVFRCQPRRMLFLALFLRPANGLLLAAWRGSRGWWCRLIATLGGAMPLQAVFKLLIVYGWLVKRLPTATVWQDEPGNAAHIVFHHLGAPFVGRQGESGPVHGDISAHTINVKVHADASN